MNEDRSSEHDVVTALPVAVLEDLLRSVPKLVDRTRGQAQLARSLVGLLPCIGPVFAPRSAAEAPGAPATERVDVLTVLSDPDPDTAPAPDAAPAPDTAPAPDAAPIVAAVADLPTIDVSSQGTSQDAPDAPSGPSEADLPIQDYDSLAASQVVPRLATLDEASLHAVQRYERSNRNRRTILNRVAQLLSA